MKIEELNKQHEENLSKFGQLYLKYEKIFKKQSYPISWVQFFETNEAQLNVQIAVGYLR